jgi:heat shock protein HtpX
MWELIRQNRRKSFILFLAMGACLLVLGYLIGRAYIPDNGGIVGIVIAGLVWLGLALISYFGGDSVLLATSRAHEITREMHPQLFNIVEEMKIAGSLPAMPKIYVIDEAAPNAFAAGRNPQNCSIAVTAGLLERMNRDELQGVIAHEMSHILNRDILFMTFAGVMLGSIVLISQFFLRGLWFSGGSSSRYRSRDSRGGQGAAIVMIIAIIFAILAPILARLFYFAISRRREYLADASAARLTRYPEGLASALEKISVSTEEMPSANSITAALYIANPVREKGQKLSDWTSTHPPISQRIKVLRAMSQGAGLLDYQQAFGMVSGKKATILPPSALKDTSSFPIRAAGTPEPIEKSSAKKREIGDLLRTVNGFSFLTCSCGLKIKTPPEMKNAPFPCPRCGREMDSKTA